MSKIIKILGILAIFFSTLIHAENNNDSIVKKLVTDYMHENNIPGMAVALYTNGIPQTYYFGDANRDKKITINQHTIFEIGSISKIMTTLLFAQQVDTAHLQMNDSITKIFPEFPNSFDDISLLNLATHTSGLPFELPATIHSKVQLENFFNHLHLKDSPEDKWIYSNLGIGLLGLSLERISHASARQLYQKNILTPLNMQAIAFVVPTRLKKYFAQGYNAENKAVTPESLDVLAMAWGIKASTVDMQHFLAAAIGLSGTPERILYPMRMTQAAYVKVNHHEQGLGWDIHSLDDETIDELLSESFNPMQPLNIEEIYEKPVFNGDKLIDKTGMTNGFNSYIAVIPNKKSGIVILSNRNFSDAQLSLLGRKILFTLNNLVDDE